MKTDEPMKPALIEAAEVSTAAWQKLGEWLRDREDNARAIAVGRLGAERAGWLEQGQRQGREE